MRLQVMSDLHLEHQSRSWRAVVDSLPRLDVDALVLAGDICGATAIIDVLTAFSERWPQVVFVHGNHELYWSGFDEVHALRGAVPANVHWLHRSSVRLSGVRFVGTTLWFPFDKLNDFYRGKISDFGLIKDFHWRVYEENEADIAYLNDTVANGDVVVTHHLPSARSVGPRHKTSQLSRFYVCPMDESIEARRPAVWVHGHSHDLSDYVLGDTRVVCNPRGYHPGGLCPEFDAGFVVKVRGAGRPAGR